MTLPAFMTHPVHQLSVADGLCDFARELRAELLRFHDWTPMTQSSDTQQHVRAYHRQNGVTSGHLDGGRSSSLPLCARFEAYMEKWGRELARQVGVDLGVFDVEMNAMAYGESCWLSPHTDHTLAGTDKPREVAWMLYLTHPDDGEWTRARGGALRVFDGNGNEARIYPRFNRFAMFRVSRESFHEVEKVTWPAGWEHCRLALSGWLRRLPTPATRGTIRYLRSPEYVRRRQEMEDYLQGARASLRLLLEQGRFNANKTLRIERELEWIKMDYEEHQAAPAGTSFDGRMNGPTGVIIVKDEEGRVVYFGGPADYAAREG